MCPPAYLLKLAEWFTDVQFWSFVSVESSLHGLLAKFCDVMSTRPELMQRLFFADVTHAHSQNAFSSLAR